MGTLAGAVLETKCITNEGLDWKEVMGAHSRETESLWMLFCHTVDQPECRK